MSSEEEDAHLQRHLDAHREGPAYATCGSCGLNAAHGCRCRQAASEVPRELPGLSPRAQENARATFEWRAERGGIPSL